jgi:predicted ester cyclase
LNLEVSTVATVTFAAPILPGQLEAWRRFTQEIGESRSAEHAESRRRLGLTREQSWLQQTPGGDLAIITFDAIDPGRAFAGLASSTAPFDRWFRDKVKELHGLDLTAPAPGAPSELFVNWSNDVAESNKARFREYIEEVWHRGNLAEMDQYFTIDHQDHSAPPGQGAGLAGMKPIFAMFQGAFSDIEVSVDDQIAEGDKLVCLNTFRVTHTGSFFGIPATGRRVTVTQTHTFRMECGKMAEHWSNSDDLGMLRQLGVIPEM